MPPLAGPRGHRAACHFSDSVAERMAAVAAPGG